MTEIEIPKKKRGHTFLCLERREKRRKKKKPTDNKSPHLQQHTLYLKKKDATAHPITCQKGWFDH